MERLSERQKEILKIVRNYGPISGEEIAEKLNLSRSTLRVDFSNLVSRKLIGSKTNRGYTFLKEECPVYVYEIMSAADCVDPNISVYDAIVHIFSKDLGTIVVAENSELKGMISRKDLLKSSINSGNLEKIPVHMIMTRVPNVIYCTANESIKDAAKKIIEHEMNALPVVEEKEGRLMVVGRFTKTNLAKLYVKYL